MTIASVVEGDDGDKYDEYEGESLLLLHVFVVEVHLDLDL